MNARYFHSYVDTYRAQLGYWTVTKREHQYLHTVQNARRVIYRFAGHTHPYTELLVSTLVGKDIAGVEKLDTDVDLRRPYFTAQYSPGLVVPEVDPKLCGSSAIALLAPKTHEPALADEGLPVDDLDFDYQSGAYSVYNWELFYHVPFTIAVNLSKNGRYAEAQSWFHYIFDPTDTSDPAQGPKRFWKVKPFKIDEVEHIESTLFNLATGDNPNERDATVRAIGKWRESPFRPHLVARTRPSAYMYATVMEYLDNLIAWGDSLFRQDTRESINEAMQLYVLAANILGPKPELIPSRGSAQKQTYASLKNRLDEFSNAAVAIEPEVAFDLFPAPLAAEFNPEHASIESVGRSLYFCIPRNEKFLSYWDTVGDRLFKIRNSLNLQGVFRQLPLFAPPIDPAMLARAVAAGVDIGAIIDGSADALLPIRSQFLVQKALEMAQEVKSLGSQILSALEKKDNETLGVLRATHEVKILDLVESVKYAQWQEAIKAREGIQVNIANAFQRFRHYDRLLGTDNAQIKLPEYADFDRQVFESRGTALEEPLVEAPDPEVSIGSSFRDGGHKVSDEEAHELDMLEAAQIAHDAATVIEAIGALTHLIPNVEASAKPLGLGAGVHFGGIQLGGWMDALGKAASGIAARISYEASRSGRMATYGRREQEWELQRKAAAGELTLLYKQLRSAEIREYIAHSEHSHHLTQIKLSKDILEFLTNELNVLKGNRRKTTTEDFYLWMKREAQSLHAKAFQFAFDIAKKSEKAVQYELGNTDLRFVQNSYLAGREGLFAGEKLYFDLKRLEMAYAENYTRQYEITKHISLRDWFPLALIELRSSGHCQIDLPEALFDLDCPGHSFRRIKSIALSIPCVVGPYASVNCALTLTQSYVRRGSGGYGGNPQDDALNFALYPAAVKSIVTSSSQADSGLFEANLKDERYLPFEGGGVISSWAIELLGKPRAFDYDTIADLVLTIRYTARAEGSRTSAEQSAEQWLKNNSACVFSMRHEFGTEWAGFKRPPTAADGRASLKFSLSKQHFPYRLDKMTQQARQMHLYFSGNASGDTELFRNSATLGTTQLVNGASFESAGFQPTGDFELTFPSNVLDDLWVVVDWSATQ